MEPSSLRADAAEAVGLAGDLVAVPVHGADAIVLVLRADSSRPRLLTAGISGECPATLGVGRAGGQIRAAVPIRIARITAHHERGGAGAIAADAGAAGVFHTAGGTHRNTGAHASTFAVADQSLRCAAIDALAPLAFQAGVCVAFGGVATAIGGDAVIPKRAGTALGNFAGASVVAIAHHVVAIGTWLRAVLWAVAAGLAGRDAVLAEVVDTTLRKLAVAKRAADAGIGIAGFAIAAIVIGLTSRYRRAGGRVGRGVGGGIGRRVRWGIGCRVGGRVRRRIGRSIRWGVGWRIRGRIGGRVRWSIGGCICRCIRRRRGGQHASALVADLGQEATLAVGADMGNRRQGLPA